MWLENLDRLPPLKKQDGENEEQEEEDDDNEDSDDHAEEVKKKYMRPKTPPPPRFVTDWTVRPSTTEEKEDFQEQVGFTCCLAVNSFKGILNFHFVLFHNSLFLFYRKDIVSIIHIKLSRIGCTRMNQWWVP